MLSLYYFTSCANANCSPRFAIFFLLGWRSHDPPYCASDCFTLILCPNPTQSHSSCLNLTNPTNESNMAIGGRVGRVILVILGKKCYWSTPTTRKKPLKKRIFNIYRHNYCCKIKFKHTITKGVPR